jgi:hypothetical protein
MTDIIGQHIHLPKWDLTTNDGAANGWNYEDGALAPAIVVERVHAINNYNKLFTLPFNASLADGADGTFNGTVVDAAFELGFADKVHPDVVAELQANNAMLPVWRRWRPSTRATRVAWSSPGSLSCMPSRTRSSEPELAVRVTRRRRSRASTAVHARSSSVS